MSIRKRRNSERGLNDEGGDMERNKQDRSANSCFAPQDEEISQEAAVAGLATCSLDLQGRLRATILQRR